MTNKEVTVSVSGEEISVILQGSFFQYVGGETPLHMHTYPEIHICICGTLRFLIDGEEFFLKENEMLIIPEGKYHKIYSDPRVKRLAFQAIIPCKKQRKYKLGSHQVEVLVSETVQYVKSGRQYGLCGAIAYILSIVTESKKAQICDISDRGFMIHDFFMYNYNRQITLSDLAKELNLSEKQAARSVKKFFGTSFSAELTKRRLEAARHLIETTDIPLQEIAEQVGYMSYSGFWKAYRSHIDKKTK